MNVLAKIVIPKTNVTMAYINNELEEYAREEFFRLKKVLEIKRKMYGGLGGKEEKKGGEKTEEENVEGLVCPACPDNLAKAEPYTEPIVEIYKSPSELSKDDDKMRDEEVEKLIKQLNEVVDVTKDLEGKGILKTSADDFLKTAKELMSKLEQTNEEEKGEECIKECQEEEEQESVQSKLSLTDIDLDKLCDTCKEKYSKINEKETQTDPVPDSEPISDSQENESAFKDLEAEENIDSTIPSQINIDNSLSEMDTLKTEVKEITKIIKTINEDGSVSIKKTVIKIENEIKTPLRSKASSRISANKSNVTGQSSKTSSHSPYSGSKTVGIVTLKSFLAKHNIPRYGALLKAKSDILKTISSRSGPTERLCMSSMTLRSTDTDFEYEIDNTDRQHIVLNTANTTSLSLNESPNIH